MKGKQKVVPRGESNVLKCTKVKLNSSFYGNIGTTFICLQHESIITWPFLLIHNLILIFLYIHLCSKLIYIMGYGYLL
jgi:hypothetical protein